MHASQYPVKVKRKVKNAQGFPKLALCLFPSFTQKLIVYFCAHVMKFFSHLVKLPPKEREWTEFRALVFFSFLYPLMSILAVSSGLVLLGITLQQQLVNSSFFFCYLHRTKSETSETFGIRWKKRKNNRRLLHSFYLPCLHLPWIRIGCMPHRESLVTRFFNEFQPFLRGKDNPPKVRERNTVNWAYFSTRQTVCECVRVCVCVCVHQLERNLICGQSVVSGRSN